MNVFSPHDLETTSRAVHRRALEDGVLLPIETRRHILPDGGVRFVVHVLARTPEDAARRRLRGRRRGTAAR